MYVKFREIISYRIKVIEWTRFLYGKLQRGIIPPKMQVEQQLLISARRLVMLLKRYQSYRANMISIGGVTAVNLCTSSGHAFVKLFQTVSKL